MVITVSSVGYKSQEVQVNPSDTRVEIDYGRRSAFGSCDYCQAQRGGAKVLIAISVLGETVEHSGAFNVNRPQGTYSICSALFVQPRNTGINIGLGSV